MTTCTPSWCRCPFSHIEWQAQVVELLHALGWSHLHVRRSIGKGHKWVTATNRIGWCDLLAWHPVHGFAAVELKVGRDKATPEQLQVLAELEAAGAATMVAFPHDLDALTSLLRPSGRLRSSSTMEG